MTQINPKNPRADEGAGRQPRVRASRPARRRIAQRSSDGAIATYLRTISTRPRGHEPGHPSGLVPGRPSGV